MKLTDEHRSLLATALVGAYHHATGVETNKLRSLCCAPDALEACARIVGKRHAEKLHRFVYETLGCCGWKDPVYQDEQEQYLLDKIADLEKL